MIALALPCPETARRRPAPTRRVASTLYRRLAQAEEEAFTAWAAYKDGQTEPALFNYVRKLRRAIRLAEALYKYRHV